MWALCISRKVSKWIYIAPVDTNELGAKVEGRKSGLEEMSVEMVLETQKGEWALVCDKHVMRQIVPGQLSLPALQGRLMSSDPCNYMNHEGGDH